MSVYTLSHSDVQKLIFADCSGVRGKALAAAATGALVAGRSNTRPHHAHSHMTALKTRLAQRKKKETRRRQRRTGGMTPPAVMGTDCLTEQPLQYTRARACLSLFAFTYLFKRYISVGFARYAECALLTEKSHVKIQSRQKCKA